MHLISSRARVLVALVAIMGVGGPAASTASASSSKSHVKHAKRLHKTSKKVARPDLQIKGLDLEDSDDGFDVSASVANTGTGLAKGSDVIVALSDDTTLDENDQVLDEYSVGSIAAGVTRSFEDDVEMPDDLDDGPAYILVCADGNEEITETNESNNCVSQEIQISGDDASADDGSDDGDDSSDPADDDSDSGAIVLTGGQS